MPATTLRILILSLAVVAIIAPSARADEPAPKPNIILIFTDDQGYQDLGCFGSPNIKTPNIDAMAKNGRRFTDFYVPAPLCTPSRAALMTGCYPRRVGMAQGVLRPDATRGLNGSEITIAEVLKTVDYETICIGKWHLGFKQPFVPRSQGFDEYYGIYHNLDHWETKHFDAVGGTPILSNGKVVKRPAEPGELTELYTGAAIDFIRRHRDQPFFVYLPHTMPHVPLGVSKRFAGRSAGGEYGDVIECLDWSTGEILKTLDKLGIRENTLVIYFSDNGPSPLATGSALPLRGRKHTTYEGGMRVPCVMSWPKGIPKGTTCSELATSMDLYPTLAALAGAAVPNDRTIDGRDIRPLLFGEEGARTPHEYFYYHDGRGRLDAVRSGQWKLHMQRKGQKVHELYNLTTDIGEETNIAAEHPEVCARLSKQARVFQEQLGKEIRQAGQVQ